VKSPLLERKPCGNGAVVRKCGCPELIGSWLAVGGYEVPRDAACEAEHERWRHRDLPGLSHFALAVERRRVEGALTDLDARKGLVRQWLEERHACGLAEIDRRKRVAGAWPKQ